MRKLVFAIVLGVLVAVAGMAFAQDPQQKLLSRRAAELDAYRKLAEMVKGFQIDSQTTVQDFVTESDEIHTEFRTFIKGAETVGSPRYFDDGTCEVDMRLTLERIITELKRIVKRFYKGSKYTDVAFDDIKKHVERKVIETTGAGVPRTEESLPDDYAEEYVSPTPSNRSPWASDPYWASINPRGRLMARRGAEVDAYRKLAEMIKGVHISSETYVRDFVTESDEIRTGFNTFLKGVTFSKYTYRPDGIVEAEAEVTLERLITELKTIKKRYYKGDKYKDVLFEDVKKYTERKIVKAIGESVVPDRYAKPIPKRQPKPRPVPVDEKPGWAKQVLRATGEGVPPDEADSEAQANLLAERAAELDAKRKLAEQVMGVKIKGETTVRDFVTESDKIKTSVYGFLAGCRIVDSKTLEDGITKQVTVELDLGGLYEIWKKHGK